MPDPTATPVDTTPNLKPGESQPPKASEQPKDDKGKSIYDDLDIDPPGKDGSTAWPTDWRLQAAGGDEKRAKQLERFSDPSAFAKSYFAAQERLRSGEYKRAAPPEGADEKAIATWREEQGLPTKPEDYNLVPDGTDPASIDDAGKAIIGQFQTAFHKANFNADQAAVVRDVLLDIHRNAAEAEATMDAQHTEEAGDALRTDWGGEFRSNIKMNIATIERHLGEDGMTILDARLPDGRKLGNMPAFSKMLNALARLEGGDILVDGVKGGTSVDSRILEIERIMARDMNEYLRTPGLADEYGKLLEKRESRKGA